MNTLNSAIFLCLIQTSVLATAVMLVRCCIPPRYAGSRAAVCGVGLTCVLAITLLTFLPLPGLWSDTVDVQQPKSVTANSAKDTSAAESSDVHSSMSQNASSNNNSSIGIQVAVSWLRHLGSGFRSAMAAVDETPRGGQVVLMLLVLGGSGIGLVRFISALRHARQAAKNSAAVFDPQAIQYLQELQRHSGCRRSISLRQTNALSAAATLGFFRPVILLPQSWREWSHDELTAVLAHEVAHVRRGDFLHRLLGQLSAAAYFFHPLVRILARWLAADQEFAADGLASVLHGNRQSYLHGLANLALRLHNSFSGEHAWSNVSIMPNSSDFLARRLNMLRTKDGSISHCAARWISATATASVVIVAMFTTLLRGSASTAAKAETPSDNSQCGDEKSTPAVNSTTIEQDAQKIEQEYRPQGFDKVRVAAVDSAKRENREKPTGDLFLHEAFDPSIIPNAKHGAFLFRLGEVLRDPQVQPHAEEFNAVLTFAAREFFKGLVDVSKYPWLADDERSTFGPKTSTMRIDLREIEWVAGTLRAVFKPSDKEGGDEQTFMLGTGAIVIHMAHARDWQQFVLEHVPGAELKSLDGHNYVGLKPLRLGQILGGTLWFPDDRTIVFDGEWSKDEVKKTDSLFYDKALPRQSYAWADAWRAADGGLLTYACDVTQTGYSDVPEKKRKQTDANLLALIDNIKCFAVGVDCSGTNHRFATQMHAVCADNQAVEKTKAAEEALLAQGRENLKGHEDDVFPLLGIGDLDRFLSGAKIETSPADGDQHFVHFTSRVTLADHELDKAIGRLIP